MGTNLPFSITITINPLFCLRKTNNSAVPCVIIILKITSYKLKSSVYRTT